MAKVNFCNFGILPRFIQFPLRKYTRKGHIWYNHNSVRFKQNCELAKPEVRRCCGKLKVPMHKGENGTFIVLFNEDGCKHFLSEFYTSFYNGLYRDSFDDMAMSVREQIWKEFFNRSYSNASIDKNVGSTTTATVCLTTVGSFRQF